MQVGIPVAYSVCEVKLDKINHWMCVHREDFQFHWNMRVGTLTVATIYL